MLDRRCGRMSDQPMLEILGLTKRFGRQEVLRGVDLTIRAERVTAIVGPNGAGKTTLIKTILGLARADDGEIRVSGTLVGNDPAYRSRIGYMPQIAHFPENLPAAEIMAMISDLRRDARSGPLDNELLEQFQLADQLDKPLRVLSGGTRQKVNAVLAFLFRPALLVLDEPSAGLDPVANGILKDKIRRQRDAGQTCVLISHVMSELDELADDVVFLLDGRVLYAGEAHDLKVETRQLNLERAIAQIMVRGAA
jgi:Cu-processing system ATP-binding protein